MGAINNAFNQAAGAVAGAALAYKHAQESDFSKMNAAEHSALVARNQSREADIAAKDASLDENQAHEGIVDAIVNSWGKDEEYYKAQEEYNKNKQKRKNASYKNVEKKLKEWQAAERAIDELDNKLFSIEAMKQRAVEQRANADKATKIALDQKQKYEKRWGGIK